VKQVETPRRKRLNRNFLRPLEVSADGSPFRYIILAAHCIYGSRVRLMGFRRIIGSICKSLSEDLGQAFAK
jgi:hypothetical protein